MRRVSASLTVVMLAASGHPVTPATLRSWVYRGHITRGRGGYDLQEILTYIEHREAHRDHAASDQQAGQADEDRLHPVQPLLQDGPAPP